MTLRAYFAASLFAVSAALALMDTAGAQVAAADLRKCASISEAPHRLSCFDALPDSQSVLPGGHGPGVTVPRVVQRDGRITWAEGWAVGRYEDAMTDERRVVVSHVIGDWDTGTHIVLDCKKGVISLVFQVRQADLHMATTGTAVPVRYRFDKKPAVSETWATVSGSLLSPPDSGAFLTEMMASDSLLLEVTGKRGPTAARADLRGFRLVAPNPDECR